MEEEKIDMREHLINWIDTFLKDGIIPKIVNPKAIETNYISKQVIRDKIEELEKLNFNNYANEYDDGNEVKNYILKKFKEIIGE